MPSDFGRYSWALRTCGRLTPALRVRLVVTIFGSFPAFIYGRFLQKRRPRRFRHLTSAEITAPQPAADIRREGDEQAAGRQSAAMTEHGYRTWMFGYALARLDGRHEQLDPDLFYLAALFHDVGLMGLVVDECFTLRSAAAVTDVASRTTRGTPEDLLALQDAVVDHVTPGITKRNGDRLMAVYVQQGTMADLTGYRIKSLPAAFIGETLAKYPRTGVSREVCGRWRGEACAVRYGRAHLLERWAMISWFFAHPPRVLRPPSLPSPDSTCQP